MAGCALDEPATAGDQGFQGPKKKALGDLCGEFVGSGHYMVVRIWMDRL